MEQLIVGLLEKSLVGGAFIYLLWTFVTKFNVSLEKIADTLVGVSGTLSRIDKRMEVLEQRVEHLEKRESE